MAKDNTKLIFPSDEIANNNISASVNNNDRMVMVNVVGMQEGDRVSFEYEVKLECESYWVPYTNCCGVVSIVHPQNMAILVLPLNYRAVLTNADDNHIADESWFEDVKVVATKFSSPFDLTNYYDSCCESKTFCEQLDDIAVDSTPIV